MTTPFSSARLLRPAKSVRNRLWAWKAGFGPRPEPSETLPDPLPFGEADRGAALAAGRWEIAGHAFDLRGGTIWDVALTDADLIAARESFGWLDDLAALGTRPARALGQAWSQGWIQTRGTGKGPGWAPDVAGRRAMHWVAHARKLTEGLDPAAAQAFWRALAMQQRYLAKAWSQADPGLARMRALAGLVWTGRALPHVGHAAAVARFGVLAREAVGADGEIGSRSPEDLAEILILLVWTARILEDAGGAAAPAQLEAIVRAVPVLRQLRMGGGFLARFHGGGGGDAIAIDKALAELRLEPQPNPRLPMGYARLTGGRAVVVMDGARPPQGRHAATAHASALAFELSVGRQPLVVNVGPGARRGGAVARSARATSGHSTVEVQGASSAGFAAGALTGGPTLVSVRQAQDATGMWLLATHDGYVASHGLLHERRIFVDARGAEVRGEDILSVTDARARAIFDRVARGGRKRVAFAARFHLHPAVEIAFGPGLQQALLTLPDGEVWELRAGGGTLAIEESVYLDAAAPEPRPTRQAVVRAEVVEYLGQVTWSLARVVEAPRAGAAAGSSRGV